MLNAINWFEIPVLDFDRAVNFYSKVLGKDIVKGEFMGAPYGFFPADEQGVGGAIVKRNDATPSTTGTLIYLNAGEDLDQVLEQVEVSGGKIVMPKTSLGSFGLAALITDTEGNRVGLHTRT